MTPIEYKSIAINNFGEGDLLQKIQATLDENKSRMLVRIVNSEYVTVLIFEV
jgi:hypothetical protein